MGGMVASSQTYATEAGVRILEQGGNAADAAVAVAAALNVTEPCMTGLGGDAFCLFYNAAEGTVRGLNASGRAPSGLSVASLLSEGVIAVEGDELPLFSPHTITVPGAVSSWTETVKAFGGGEVSLSDVLQPAIALAEGGFPLGPVSAVG